MVESSALSSWLYAADCGTHFPLENIPFGVAICPKTGHKMCVTRVGDFLVDLGEMEKAAKFDGPLHAALGGKHVFHGHQNLNAFAAHGKPLRVEVRATLQRHFGSDNQCNSDAIKAFTMPAEGVKMDLPVFVRDYTDFYSSYDHAYNVGVMIRGPDNAIQPNWLHLPVGYHGRASSIVVDGTPIRRPKGQVTADKVNPSWSECKRMDFELEMGTIIARGNEQGTPIKVNDAREHIFGFTLLNDWSARDLQVWEYVPLGPFNAKNFGSTLSPWVITPEALEPFKVALGDQKPEMLPYLQDADRHSYDIKLGASIKTPTMDKHEQITESNMKYLYYSVAQTIAHHTVTGCNMNTGDMLGTGTISGPEKTQYGSMMELCWGGKEEIKLSNGEVRKFIQDGDSINLTGVCHGKGYTIGFGNCEGTVLPAHDDSHFA